MILPNPAHVSGFYLSTCSGQRLDLLAPLATQIDIDDIAHGLAYQSCFNGQTSHFYSLAQHSLLVASLVPRQQRLAALLHDASAAYFGDMAPSMRQLFPDFSIIEKKVMAAISEKFELPGLEEPALKRAHRIILATEHRDLRPDLTGIGDVHDHLAPIPRRIEFMSPEEARFQFKELFTELTRKLPSRKALHAVSVTKEHKPSGDCAPTLLARSKKNRDAQSLLTMDASRKQAAPSPARL